MDLEFLHELIIPAKTKIAMVIMDGLGGLPLEPGGKTELETAQTPNLDALAHSSLPWADSSGWTWDHGRKRSGPSWHFWL